MIYFLAGGLGARAIANRPGKIGCTWRRSELGPIVAAAGRAGVRIDINRLGVRVGGTLLFENGLPHADAICIAADYLKGESVRIDVSLGSSGNASVTILTCDVTPRYTHTKGKY